MLREGLREKMVSQGGYQVYCRRANEAGRSGQKGQVQWPTKTLKLRPRSLCGEAESGAIRSTPEPHFVYDTARADSDGNGNQV